MENERARESRIAGHEKSSGAADRHQQSPKIALERRISQLETRKNTLRLVDGNGKRNSHWKLMTRELEWKFASFVLQRDSRHFAHLPSMTSVENATEQNVRLEDDGHHPSPVHKALRRINVANHHHDSVSLETQLEWRKACQIHVIELLHMMSVMISGRVRYDRVYSGVSAQLARQSFHDGIVVPSANSVETARIHRLPGYFTSA